MEKNVTETPENKNPMTEKLVSREFTNLGDGTFSMVEVKQFDNSRIDPTEVFGNLEKVKQIAFQKTMQFDGIIARLMNAVRGYNSFILDPSGKDAVESKRQILETKATIDHVLLKIPALIDEVIEAVRVFNGDIALMTEAKNSLELTYDVPAPMDVVELLSNIDKTIHPAPEGEQLTLDVNKAKGAWSKLAGDVELPPFILEEDILERIDFTRDPELNAKIEERRLEKMAELEADQKKSAEKNNAEEQTTEEKNVAEEEELMENAENITPEEAGANVVTDNCEGEPTPVENFDPKVADTSPAEECDCEEQDSCERCGDSEVDEVEKTE